MCRTSTGGHASHICCRITCTGATRWVLEELSANSLDRVKWKPPMIAEVVDRRVVVNPRQARELLAAVTYVGRPGAGVTCGRSSRVFTSPRCGQVRSRRCVRTAATCPRLAGAGSPCLHRDRSQTGAGLTAGKHSMIEA